MALQITIELSRADRRAFEEALKRLQKLGRAPRRSFGRTALFILRQARRLLAQRTQEWGPRSGKLAKSLTYVLDSMSVTVGSNLVYAAIQQLGGLVVPTGGRKYLAIPVNNQLRRSGTYPRDIPRGDLKFVRAAAIRVGRRSWIGPALVRAGDQRPGGAFQGAGRGLSPRGDGPTRPADEVMFALVRRANIKGREYLVFRQPGMRFLLNELRAEARAAWSAKAG